jgi:hypothetical protein
MSPVYTPLEGEREFLLLLASATPALAKVL